MKMVSILFLLGSFAVFAAAPKYEISCGVNKQRTQGGYRVSASIKGTVTGQSGTSFNLDDYAVKYTIYSDSYVWGSETITGGDLANDASYKPREYKGHVRFNLPSKEGKVELIYPESLSNKKKFSAILILTNISDHFGGTAYLYCSRKLVK